MDSDPYAHTAARFVVVVIMAVVVTVMVTVFRRYDDDRASANFVSHCHSGAG